MATTLHRAQKFEFKKFTINFLPLPKQERIAVETRELYAPLAHRLGMNNIKVQIED